MVPVVLVAVGEDWFSSLWFFIRFFLYADAVIEVDVVAVG
jgi:hypothetical protein